MAQALVPLKDLVQAKTRLAGILSPSERRALAQSMVEDVLEGLSHHPEIERITLLSDDPGAHLLAARYRARYWPEAEFQGSGLNQLIGLASQRLLAESAQPLLVLHGDLPLLERDDISAVVELQQRAGGLVIGCDRLGIGTNLLCFDGASVPEFCFGADSCARHERSSRSRGTNVRVLRREGVGFDVDEPADLAQLLPELSRRGIGHTAGLLVGTPLEERVRLALQSVEVSTSADTEHRQTNR